MLRACQSCAISGKALTFGALFHDGFQLVGGAQSGHLDAMRLRLLIGLRGFKLRVNPIGAPSLPATAVAPAASARQDHALAELVEAVLAGYHAPAAGSQNKHNDQR